MDITLRQETENDYAEVFEIVKKAFKDLDISDHTEQFLVERLRKTDAFIPELSIVAEHDNQIVGHIMLTKTKIEHDNDSFESLTLAPVAVKPEYQRQGIGGKLIMESHRIARELGYKSIVVVGHESYYPKFGYRPASTYNITCSFDVPDENLMIIELVENGLKGVCGTIVHPKEFFE